MVKIYLSLPTLHRILNRTHLNGFLDKQESVEKDFELLVVVVLAEGFPECGAESCDAVVLQGTIFFI